jgi:probable H4MPT-linked C1 transfer pathway protein
LVEHALQLPCPLWQGLPFLTRSLAQADSIMGPARLHAVTMTGEMADLFPSRSEGVAQLVTAMGRQFPDARLRYYAGSDGFVEAEQAIGANRRVASANWRASAALVATRTRDALFVDIGSSTTDLVPIQGGQICACGEDDPARLRWGELVYSGVVRTPVFAVASEAPFCGEWVPLMAEVFATTADVHRLTGQLPEGADQLPAADGGEKSLECSARRLARMIGHDAASRPLTAWQRLAAWLARAQSRQLEDACERLLSRVHLPDQAPLIGAGVGRFLIADLAARLHRPYLEFSQLLPAGRAAPERVSDCAPAVAVAWLARALP